jgi:hypothetical protein
MTSGDGCVQFMRTFSRCVSVQRVQSAVQHERMSIGLTVENASTMSFTNRSSPITTSSSMKRIVSKRASMVSG